jgi:hypothetical protein
MPNPDRSRYKLVNPHLYPTPHCEAVPATNHWLTSNDIEPPVDWHGRPPRWPRSGFPGLPPGLHAAPQMMS